MVSNAVADMLRPYLWLALAAFVAGFLSFVVVGRAGAPAAPEPSAEAPLVSTPASGDWNLPKRI